jgi:hypothetical protein
MEYWFLFDLSAPDLSLNVEPCSPYSTQLTRIHCPRWPILRRPSATSAGVNGGRCWHVALVGDPANRYGPPHDQKLQMTRYRKKKKKSSSQMTVEVFLFFKIIET